MGNVLAKNKAAKAGAAEIILHRDGIVTEGASSNVLIVKEGKVYSHPDNQFILPGITKLVVKRCAQAARIPFIEENFTVEQLFAADEVIMTNSVFELAPVIELDGKQVSNGVRGRFCELLEKAYEALVIEQCGAL